MDDFYRLCIHQNWTDIQSNSCRVDKTGSVTFLRWFILQNWTDNAWSRRSHLVYYVVWRAKIDKVWIQAWVALQSKTVWLSSRWMNLSSRWMWSFIPPPRTAKLVDGNPLLAERGCSKRLKPRHPDVVVEEYGWARETNFQLQVGIFLAAMCVGWISNWG